MSPSSLPNFFHNTVTEIQTLLLPYNLRQSVWLKVRIGQDGQPKLDKLRKPLYLLLRDF